MILGLFIRTLFFGKPLVVCMQTGRSTLLDPSDLADKEYLQIIFKMNDLQEAADLAEFFSETLPNMPYEPEYY